MMRLMLLVLCIALHGCMGLPLVVGGPYDDTRYQSGGDQQQYLVSCLGGMFGSWKDHHWMTPEEAAEVNRTGIYQDNSLHGKCTTTQTNR